MLVWFTSRSVLFTTKCRETDCNEWMKCTRYSFISVTCGRLVFSRYYYTAVSSTNETDRYNISELLLKVMLKPYHKPNQITIFDPRDNYISWSPISYYACIVLYMPQLIFTIHLQKENISIAPISHYILLF